MALIGLPKMSSNTKTIALLYITGFCLRSLLIFSESQSTIGNHIEVSTPLNSWKRVLEGLYLQPKGINSYEGDLLHEPPIVMLIYQTLTETMPVEIVFLLVDAATSILLYFIAKKYMFQLFIQQEEHKHEYPQDSAEFLLGGMDFRNAPVYVLAAFLCNPYTIFTCAGLSTMVFHNFFLSLFLFSMLHGRVVVSTIALAFCTMMSLYPVILIIPLFLYFHVIHQKKNHAKATVPIFLTTLIALKLISTSVSKTDAYLENVYGFILTVPDLQPNIGLFWYFFTEMFEHFRKLFLWSLQINATILYLLPLSNKFRNDPFLLTVALLSLISVFKSYPCIGDVGFVISLLPCFIHLCNYSQQGFLVGVIFLVTTALGPVLWHLWIYLNSANANFYFGATLAFAIAQIFLVTDILFAYLKREFCLKFGKERKVDGKEAQLILE